MADRVLVAGATGYLGGFIVQSLRQHGLEVVALVLPSTPVERRSKLNALGVGIVEGDACWPETLTGACAGASTAISCLAADMHQAHGTIWEVDRDANIALFDEAARAGCVRHFVLVATFEGREARVSSQLSRAKEEAVDYITQRAQQLGMRCSIIRPTAYFKDFTDFPWRAARQGGMTLLGSGRSRYNPIHGADLADFITEELILRPQPGAGPPLAAPGPGAGAAAAAEGPAGASCSGGGGSGSSGGGPGGGLRRAAAGGGLVEQYPMGGPEVLSLPDVLRIAAEVQGRDPAAVRIRHVPLWLVRLATLAARALGRAGVRRAGVLAVGLEFALYGSTHDSIGAAWGSRTVRQYYEEKLKQEAGAPG